MNVPWCPTCKRNHPPDTRDCKAKGANRPAVEPKVYWGGVSSMVDPIEAQATATYDRIRDLARQIRDGKGRFFDEHGQRRQLIADGEADPPLGEAW